MKKRKPPFVLISVLVVLIGAVAIINRPVPSAEEQQQQESEATVLAQGRDTRESTDSLATMAANSVGSTKAKKAPGGPEGDEAGQDPIVVGQKRVKWDPKPNDTNMSGQFYREESGTK